MAEAAGAVSNTDGMLFLGLVVEVEGAIAPVPGYRNGQINQALGLTVYCWRVRLDPFAYREFKCHASAVQPCPASGVRGRDGDPGRWASAAARPCPTSPARSPSKSRAQRPIPIRAAPSKSMASAIAPIPRMPTPRWPMARRCAPPASARRPRPCWNRPPSPIPATRRCSAAYGRALADNGNFQQALRRAVQAPIRPTIRTGASSRCREPRSTSSAATTRRARYYASALKIVPDEPSVLSNLGLSYMLTKDLPKAEETLRRAYASAGADAAGAAESRPRGRPAGPLCRSRKHRQGRPAAGRGGRQCRLSEGDAEPQGHRAAAGPMAALNRPD